MSKPIESEGSPLLFEPEGDDTESVGSQGEFATQALETTSSINIPATDTKAGLTETEARARLKVHGYNQLEEIKVPWYKILIKYFSGPLELMVSLPQSYY